MARTEGRKSEYAALILRKGAALVAALGVAGAATIVATPAAYADSLSNAQAELAAAQAELTAANAELTKANNELAGPKAAKTYSDNVRTQANTANGVTSDFHFAGQLPVYTQVNGSTARPASSTQVAVKGTFQNSGGGYDRNSILNYINQVRYDAYKDAAITGVTKYQPLTWSANLERTAQIRAVEVSIYGDHTRPSGEKWYGLSDEGLMQAYGENLSWGANFYNNVKMWVDEKADYIKYLKCKAGQTSQCSYGQYGHYTNLINQSFTQIGIAQFTTDRSTVNPYGTAMAAELAYNVKASGSADVKKADTDLYQGVFVKNGSLGAIGAAGATTFSPAAVSGDPVFYRNAAVNEMKALAKSQADGEWNRVASAYNAAQTKVNAAQAKVNTAQAKVNAAQQKVNSATATKPSTIPSSGSTTPATGSGSTTGSAGKTGGSTAGTGTSTGTSGKTGGSTAGTTKTYSFKDVPASHPFYNDITWMAQKGITTGYADGTFHPSESVSRAAFAAFMYRMAGSPSFTAPKTTPFVDVPTNHQFYKEISWMAQKGISKGWDVGGGKKEFRPNQAIGRDAIAAFLYRAAGSPKFTATKSFKDCANNEHKTAINWMATVGISTGWADGTFRPANLTERAAMAAFLHRFDAKGYKVK